MAFLADPLQVGTLDRKENKVTEGREEHTPVTLLGRHLECNPAGDTESQREIGLPSRENGVVAHESLPLSLWSAQEEGPSGCVVKLRKH